MLTNLQIVQLKCSIQYLFFTNMNYLCPKILAAVIRVSELLPETMVLVILGIAHWGKQVWSQGLLRRGERRGTRGTGEGRRAVRRLASGPLACVLGQEVGCFSSSRVGKLKRTKTIQPQAQLLKTYVGWEVDFFMPQPWALGPNSMLGSIGRNSTSLLTSEIEAKLNSNLCIQVCVYDNILSFNNARHGVLKYYKQCPFKVHK